ncbi:WXG100 family type VII secretion target [Embleya sp. NPDC020630]|uniref:WXG100 family type VII secretion target n=1 Tax=Embleya sp. NPDC020630 TaxID=3363979 RepID=UPI00378A0041
MSDPSKIRTVLNPGMPQSVIPPGNGGSTGPNDKTKVEAGQLRASAKTLHVTAGEVNTVRSVPDALSAKTAFAGWQLAAPLVTARWKDQIARLTADLGEISDGLYSIADNYDRNEHAVTISLAGKVS